MYRPLSFSLSKSTYLSPPSKPLVTSVSSARLIPVRSLSSAAAPDPDDQSSNDPLLRKLEDVIHRIIVRRSAPDWLPFVPGSSYWVPPPRSGAGSLGLAQLVERLARPAPDQEPLSPASSRGWPSPDFFIHGAHSPEMASKVRLDKMEEEIGSSHFCETEDEEG